MAGAALAALVAFCAPAARGQEWNEFGLERPPAAVPDVEVREPLFAWLLSLADGDSLGAWDGAAVRSRVAASGRPSNFPLERVTGVARRRTAAGTPAVYAAAPVRAEWDIDLDGPLDMALPYSILGYHPGSLRMAGRLRLLELEAGALRLAGRFDGADIAARADSVRIWALEGGYMLLDADGLVDKLLGPALDDSWVLGFVTGRVDGRLLGVGVFTGRGGRPIFGEFDFANDRVLPHGGAAAALLSRSSRRWLDPALGRLPPPWRESEAPAGGP